MLFGAIDHGVHVLERNSLKVGSRKVYEIKAANFVELFFFNLMVGRSKLETNQGETFKHNYHIPFFSLLLSLKNKV